MFDPTLESPIPFSEVSKLKWLPNRRRGSRLALPTLYRWAGRGVRGVTLETISIGSQRCTSEQALRRFFQAIAESRCLGPRPVRTSMRQKQIAQAEQYLQRHGI
ncbi:MAG: DUF1580 domain-containing protein [Planctomycetia bacterium]|nr:DUF1580 domain-containing protein [Planctomycetia bacterium]